MGAFAIGDSIWPVPILCELWYYIRAYMPEKTQEVIDIRRILILILICIMFAAVLILPARAAALDSKAGAVTTTGGRLNVRAQASSNAPVVATLSKGNYITLISQSGSWWKVEYGAGKYGYCHSDYITIVQGTPVTVNTGALNVRSGPGTSYDRIATVYQSETVILLTTSNGWSRILYHGTKTGYVSAKYLSNYYAPVSLWVQNFKQMDPRWADVRIGTSGKTMAQIGCATTAIAMLESHRVGRAINPEEMSRNLKYTPSGNVYWPSHFRSVNDASGLLGGIYSRLQQGKPILFGATNAYGSQHWVIITGYTGESSLTASGFTIRDPGSYSRTNLQQFLNEYPNFYKYFFY